jgi:hypothetical protein
MIKPKSGCGGEKGCVGSGEVSGDDRNVFKAIKQMKKRKKLFG